MNVGMDLHMRATPKAYHPGVGLRPGSEQVDFQVEQQVPKLFAALYESMAAHARLGLNVVADVNHHETYSQDWNILADCAGRLIGLPVIFVGVRCAIEKIWNRREETWGQKKDEVDEGVRFAVHCSQKAASLLTYDLECDTSNLSPEECAEMIATKLDRGTERSAFFAYASG